MTPGLAPLNASIAGPTVMTAWVAAACSACTAPPKLMTLVLNCTAAPASALMPSSIALMLFSFCPGDGRAHTPPRHPHVENHAQRVAPAPPCVRRVRDRHRSALCLLQQQPPWHHVPRRRHLVSPTPPLQPRPVSRPLRGHGRQRQPLALPEIPRPQQPASLHLTASHARGAYAGLSYVYVWASKLCG